MSQIKMVIKCHQKLLMLGPPPKAFPGTNKAKFIYK